MIAAFASCSDFLGRCRARMSPKKERIRSAPATREEAAIMCRTRWFLAFTLLLLPHTSPAVQLRWNSGSSALTFAGASRCTLLVHADSAEARLPSEWRLLWVADISAVQFVAMDSLEACLLDEAQVSRIEGPATASDSSANQI